MVDWEITSMIVSLKKSIDRQHFYLEKHMKEIDDEHFQRLYVVSTEQFNI